MARKLNQQVNSAYGTPIGLQDVFPSPIVALINPSAADIGYPIGQVWINKSAHQVYVMSGSAAGVATWSLASPGASDVDTINSLSPVGGDILIDGGTNLTDVNAGHTVTLNLNSAITLATSVTSPLYTSAAAANVQVTAPAGRDMILQMGDAAGANKVSFTDSTAAEVFSIDSNGTFGTLTGMTVTGALTQTAGVVNIGQDNAANAVNIGGGTTARAIGIGNSAAAHILTLGSTNTTAATILQSGTGDLVLTSTDRLTADAVGVLELNSSAAAIGIGNDANAFAINIGTGAAQRPITIGNVTGTTGVTVNSGSSACAWNTTNGSFTLSTGTGAINLGTDAVQKNLILGNITGTTSVNVNSGTGACAWTTTNGSFGLVTGTGAINLGTDAAQKNMIIGNATGTSSVIVNGGTGAMQFGANAIAHNTTIGSVTGTASTTIQSGTGDLLLTSTDEIDLDSVGVLELNSSGAAISIGNDAANFAVNVGTAGTRTVTLGSTTTTSSTVIQSGTGAANFASNATDHTTTVGSTSGVSATVLQAGTGKFTMTGTVRELSGDYVTRTGDSITFYSNPTVSTVLSTGGAPTGVAADVNIVHCREGVIMEEYVIGTQTIIAPRMDANGLLVSGDLTVAEGYEYNFGAARTNSRHAFTIGTSPAFQFELRMRIATMAGAAPYVFGFRKVEANNAVFNDYTDYATIGMIAGTSATQVVTSTELNAGGNTITNCTDLWGGNGTTNTMTVKVSAAGVVTYLLNGVAPTVVAAFTFDNGDVVVPFIRLTHSATPGAVELVSMKIGPQV